MAHFDLVWWASAAIIFAGCLVQTAAGFGLALVAAPVVVLLRPEWVPVVLTFSALVLSLLNAWNLRRAVQWRAMALPMITRIPGTVLGAWILTLLDATALQLLVAALVLLAVAISLFGKAFEATPMRLGIAGFASGITGTTTSIGGPPMALVMQHGAPDTVRANLSLYFTYSCALALASYWLIGRLDARLTLVSLSFMPGVVLGFALGRSARAWVAARFRPVLLVLCSAAALVAIAGVLAQ